MSLHVFGAILTPLGTAANNRGESEGNITTLQKLVWNGQVHTTVSAEAIRFALRRRLGESEPTNRSWNEEDRLNDWQDPTFKRWDGKSKEQPFVDDDLLGYMQAEGAKEEGGSKKGTVKARRAVLEVSRAVSLTPWSGDVTFNAASPGATASAQKKGSNPVPYGTEMHATRYQYGFALTPEKLHDAARAKLAIEALCNLGEVAGNHGRFLFDFSPDSIILRVSHDPAPRILYTFGLGTGGAVHVDELVRKVGAGDIEAKELIIGGAIGTPGLGEKLPGASVHAGVKAACAAACARIG
jgi:CRISPR-associated protein Cst2